MSRHCGEVAGRQVDEGLSAGAAQAGDGDGALGFVTFDPLFEKTRSNVIPGVYR